VKLRLGYHINILASVALSSAMDAAYTSINAESAGRKLLSLNQLLTNGETRHFLRPNFFILNFNLIRLKLGMKLAIVHLHN
jgi:hypothetical protein